MKNGIFGIVGLVLTLAPALCAEGLEKTIDLKLGVLVGQYDRDRSEGLTKLNLRYIEKIKQRKKELMAGGDLANANEAELQIQKLQKEIDDLKRPKRPKTDKEITALLSGSKWRFHKGRVVTFRESGTILKSWGELRPKWVVKNSHVEFEGRIYKFNADFTEMIRVSGIEDLGSKGVLIE